MHGHLPARWARFAFPPLAMILAGAFATSAAHVGACDSLQGERDASNTVYVGVMA